LGPDLATIFLLLPTPPQCLEIEYRSEDPVAETGLGAIWWTAKVVPDNPQKDRTPGVRYLGAGKLLFLMICTAKSAWDDSQPTKLPLGIFIFPHYSTFRSFRSIFIYISFKIFRNRHISYKLFRSLFINIFFTLQKSLDLLQILQKSLHLLLKVLQKFLYFL
jgi:hypothetical protein